MQQLQGTSPIDRVVRYGHCRALFQVIDFQYFAGVGTERCNKNVCDGLNVRAAGAVELVHKRFVLKKVGIQAFFCELHIWLDVVGEHLDLQFNSFLEQQRPDLFEYFGMRCGAGPNHQFIGRLCGDSTGQHHQGEQFLHVLLSERLRGNQRVK